MDNNQTVTSGDNNLQFQSSSGIYNITPTTLVSERDLTYIANHTSQTDFNSGTFTNTVATDGTIQMVSGVNWDRCTGGTAISGGDSAPKNNCFDNNTSTYWASSQATTNVSGNAYIGYDFGLPVNITYLRLIQYSHQSNAITSAILEYSDDGTSFNRAQTISLLNNVSTYQEFTINSKHEARYWRLKANANPIGGGTWYVYELEMFSPSGNVNFVSPGVDLSSVSGARYSCINWTGDNVLVRTSIDGGTTWTEVEKGGSISGIDGTSLGGKTFKYKVQLTNPYGKLNDITAVVGNDRVDGPVTEEGKISSIIINSQYMKEGKSNSEPPATAVFLNDKQLTQIVLSGDGKKLFYANPSDSYKLYVLNLLTGETKKIFDNSFTSLKVTYDGSNAAIWRASNYTLYYYNEFSGTNTIKTVSSVDIMYYDIQDNGTLYYANISSGISSIYQYAPLKYNSLLTTLSYAIYGIDTPEETDCRIYYYTLSELYELVLTPKGWTNNLLTSFSSFAGIRTNKDGSIVFLKNTTDWYSYHILTKTLQKLNLPSSSTMVKAVDNNKIIIQDNSLKYLYYDLATDTYKDITPSDVKINTITDVYFDVNLAGNKMAYIVSTGGVKSYCFNGIEKPERYLFSFDGKSSWHSCKDGTWVLASSEPAPTKTDFDGYGMTSDEVNALTEADFASLYANGRQIYSVDVAIYFTSSDIYTTPSIKSITVTVDNSLNDDGIGQSGPTLYAVKKQDFNITDCRKIKKIYPVELSPKAAEYYYFVKMDGNYKAWNSANNNWNTVANASTEGTYFNVQDNWITLTKDGMTAEELRNIPEAGLYSLLSAVNKTINIVYVMKVADESTEAYSSLINMDYVTEYFSGTKTILVITFNDGTASKQFTGLSESLVENFMEWLMGRQQNIGPIFYHLNNDFINYYMIQNVTAQ